MDDMPKPRLPHLRREKTRHGKMVWYVRQGDGPRVRLKAEFGTPEFQDEYLAALAARPASPASARARSGSLQWLYDRYRETDAWRSLSPATRRQRENIFSHVMDASGHQPFAALERRDIEAGKDTRRETPAQARNFLDAVRGLFRWALSVDHISSDPTAGVTNTKRVSSAGFPVWTEPDVARYEAKWGPGTRQRVWFHVLLYTGLRRGDAVRFGRQHVRDGIGVIKTEKTGMEVALPILPVLAVTLEQGPCGDLAFICGATGHPLTKESFGNVFSEACGAAGVRKSAHGVRKIGATRAAENGATVAELEAIFGWSGGGMASLYTRAADRRRLAVGAIGKMARTAEQRSSAAPDIQAAAPKKSASDFK